MLSSRGSQHFFPACSALPHFRNVMRCKRTTPHEVIHDLSGFMVCSLFSQRCCFLSLLERNFLAIVNRSLCFVNIHLKRRKRARSCETPVNSDSCRRPLSSH